MKIPEPTLAWKSDWAEARAALTTWWQHTGLAVSVTAPKDEPWEELISPGPPANPDDWWLNVDRWSRSSIYNLSRTYFGGAAFPSFRTFIGGPGSLGLFLGAIGHTAPATLWYEPVIHDPDTHPPLRVDRINRWWQLHLDVLQRGTQESRGRYLVGMPDLIENIDTLAQLRDGQLLLLDLIERPAWVKQQIARINECFFETYEAFLPYTRDPWGGTTFNVFNLWAPGTVAKVQCDFSCMISAEMFREFVVPSLTEQCEWLDYSMYHLDGTNALHHLDALLAIEPLDAIEWTPQAGLEGGGSPRWYDIYRRIKAAGKSVQAIGVKLNEVEPLIEAVGAEGMYILTSAPTETDARSLLQRVGDAR